MMIVEPGFGEEQYGSGNLKLEMPLGHPSADLRRRLATGERSGPAGDRNLAGKSLWVVSKTRRPDAIAKVWKWSKD